MKTRLAILALAAALAAAQTPVKEMSKGWFAGKGIRAGAKLQGLDKAPPPQ